MTRRPARGASRGTRAECRHPPRPRRKAAACGRTSSPSSRRRSFRPSRSARSPWRWRRTRTGTPSRPGWKAPRPRWPARSTPRSPPPSWRLSTLATARGLDDSADLRGLPRAGSAGRRHPRHPHLPGRRPTPRSSCTATSRSGRRRGRSSGSPPRWRGRCSPPAGPPWATSSAASAAGTPSLPFSCPFPGRRRPLRARQRGGVRRASPACSAQAGLPRRGIRRAGRPDREDRGALARPRALHRPAGPRLGDGGRRGGGERRPARVEPQRA